MYQSLFLQENCTFFQVKYYYRGDYLRKKILFCQSFSRYYQFSQEVYKYNLNFMIQSSSLALSLLHISLHSINKGKVICQQILQLNIK